MSYRVFAVLVFVFYGCHFDPSTGTPSDGGNISTGSDECAGFQPASCGDCGLEVCFNDPAGPQILCQADPSAAACTNGLMCNSEGLCQSQVACSPGLSRKCGDCGSESCIAGTWSGECLADDNACSTGTLCHPEPSQGGSLECQAACSTEDHQTPLDGNDLNTGSDAGTGSSSPYGSGPIPDIVPIGVAWLSIDGCESEGGYKRCICRFDYSGDPIVDCDNYCEGGGNGNGNGNGGGIGGGPGDDS